MLALDMSNYIQVSLLLASFIAGLLDSLSDSNKKRKSFFRRYRLPTVLLLIFFGGTLQVLVDSHDKEVKYKNHLSHTVKELHLLYAPFKFHLDNPSMDSAKRVEELNSMVFQIDQLIGTECDNPIVTRTPLLDSLWKKLTEDMRKVNWDLNGYAKPPIDATYNELNIDFAIINSLNGKYEEFDLSTIILIPKSLHS